MDDILSAFKKAFNAVDKGVKKGAIKALNKATTATKNELLKDLKDETGLPVKKLRERVRSANATNKIPQSKIEIATKHGTSLALFKAKEVKIKLPGTKKPGQRGRPRNRTYFGVSVKIGKESRKVVPGGFLRDVRGGAQVIFTRIGKERKPIIAMKTDLIPRYAEAEAPVYRRRLSEIFFSTVEADIAKSLDETIAKQSE